MKECVDKSAEYHKYGVGNPYDVKYRQVETKLS
jgi:hypothetical protein